MSTETQNFAICPTVLSIEERIGGYLKQFGDTVMPVDPWRWWITRPEDGQARTMVAVDQNWLVVEQALSGCRFADVGDVQVWGWRLLDTALDLPSGARPVLPEKDGLVRIRAERSLAPQPNVDGDEDLQCWIESACVDVAVGPVGALPTAVDDYAHTPSGGDEANYPDIQALCELAGWSATPRGTSGEMTVALPARDGGVCHAIAAAVGAQVRFRVALEVSPAGGKTPACLAAVAVALLRVAGAVRLVRATAAQVKGSGAAAFLDVRAQPPLEPDAVHHALSSLAVAHQQIAAELNPLSGDDALANAYLVLHGAR